MQDFESQVTSDVDSYRHWVALRMVEGIGDVTLRDLIAHFKDPSIVFNASKRELLRVDGIGEKTADAIKGFSRWDDVERELERCRKAGVSLSALTDAEYPLNLKEIYNPPSLIYRKGSLLPQDKYAIAVVGTRNPDGYGRLVAEKLGEELALMGVTVVSGMARGIDSIAHRAAIRAGGRTIAVLGSGIDVVYPPENRRLYQDIAMHGSCITEFPTGTKPDSVNFPRRNRIISGLSLGVVVVQATERSGALITASCALEQNREVFAVPGDITRKQSRGTNKLIKSGAKPIECASDIIDEIAELRNAAEKVSSRSGVRVGAGLTTEESTICSALENGSLNIDDLSRATGISVPKALSVLLSLELKGVVVQRAGKIFELKL
jgi:DNA processing protein